MPGKGQRVSAFLYQLVLNFKFQFNSISIPIPISGKGPRVSSFLFIQLSIKQMTSMLFAESKCTAI